MRAQCKYIKDQVNQILTFIEFSSDEIPERLLEDAATLYELLDKAAPIIAKFTDPKNKFKSVADALAKSTGKSNEELERYSELLKKRQMESIALESTLSLNQDKVESYMKQPNDIPAKYVKYIEQVPNELRAKVEKAKVEKVKAPMIPFGAYGEWDYFNADWTKVPTVADIPEIMRQKQLRYPSNPMWKSEEGVIKWFEDKGWIPKNTNEEGNM